MIQSVGDVIDEIENGLDCESPIESRLCWQLRRLGVDYEAQKVVGNRRLDIVIGKINVECDGKDFHDEKTDMRRDIEVSNHGYKIIRITGSEIRRDPRRLAWMVGLITDSKMKKLSDVFSPSELFDIKTRENYPHDMMIKIYSRSGYFWVPCDLDTITSMRGSR